MVVKLKQFVGDCKGILVAHAFDVVLVEKGERDVRVGFLPHHENAALRFIRFLREDLRAEIHRECVELRKAEGKPSIAPFTVSPPDPKLIRAALKGQRRGKKKTTSQIILPENMSDE